MCAYCDVRQLHVRCITVRFLCVSGQTNGSYYNTYIALLRSYFSEFLRRFMFLWIFEQVTLSTSLSLSIHSSNSFSVSSLILSSSRALSFLALVHVFLFGVFISLWFSKPPLVFSLHSLNICVPSCSVICYFAVHGPCLLQLLVFCFYCLLVTESACRWFSLSELHVGTCNHRPL
jgi:hypothetical protein